MTLFPGNLADALLDPTAYPWSPETVERIETHVSWVFLAGDRVVKIKRPVDLGFVDLRSPEARLAACLAEDSLNRRLTDDMYLGVEAVTLVSGAPKLGGPGPVIETAVVMRRLPADRMLDHLIAASEVPLDAVSVIAGRLIPFHQTTERFGQGDPIACANQQAAVLRENVEQTLALPRPAGCSRLTGLISDLILRAVDDLTPLMQRRCADGQVVDGHGDLRADHICMTGAQPQIFDCLEFDAGLRRADVASDLAFLLMDLQRLGAPTLAADLLRRYRDAGFDLPDSLLRLYIAHRALVRVKVGLIEQQQGIPGALDRMIAEYLDAAASAVLSVSPCLIAVAGLSGTGKSAVAERVGRAFGIEVLQSDAIRRRLEPDPDPAVRYLPERVAAVYAEMRAQARATLRAGKPVILDATFLDVAERTRAEETAARTGVPFLLVHVTASEAAALRRIRTRAASGISISDAGKSVYLRQRERASRQPMEAPAYGLFVEVDNDADGPTPLDPVVAALEAAGVLVRTITSWRQGTG